MPTSSRSSAQRRPFLMGALFLLGFLLLSAAVMAAIVFTAGVGAVPLIGGLLAGLSKVGAIALGSLLLTAALAFASGSVWALGSMLQAKGWLPWPSPAKAASDEELPPESTESTEQTAPAPPYALHPGKREEKPLSPRLLHDLPTLDDLIPLLLLPDPRPEQEDALQRLINEAIIKTLDDTKKMIELINAREALWSADGQNKAVKLQETLSTQHYHDTLDALDRSTYTLETRVSPNNLFGVTQAATLQEPLPKLTSAQLLTYEAIKTSLIQTLLEKQVLEESSLEAFSKTISPKIAHAFLVFAKTAPTPAPRPPSPFSIVPKP